jgi:hypothetical protein
MNNYHHQFDTQDPSFFLAGDASSASHNSKDLAPNAERGGALLLADPETVLVFKIFKYKRPPRIRGLLRPETKLEN